LLSLSYLICNKCHKEAQKHIPQSRQDRQRNTDGFFNRQIHKEISESLNRQQDAAKASSSNIVWTRSQKMKQKNMLNPAIILCLKSNNMTEFVTFAIGCTGNTVVMVIRLRSGLPRSRGLIPDIEKRFFSSPQCLDRLLIPLHLLFN
jgi:hypothetical protein